MANINHFDFKNYRVFETEIAGRKLTVETGKMAQLANGSCLVRYGETAVLVTATASAKPRDGIDFFPLSVDFEERMYAVGRIPGSFMRREGRPSEKAILSSRQIDRPMRPLFPKDLRNDVSIVCTVLENDYDNSPEVVALLGASIAVSISDIPFDYVVAGQFCTENPKLSASAVHSRIESDIDYLLYERACHRPITEFDPEERYQLSPIEQAVLSVVLHAVLKTVYGADVSTHELRRSFAEMTSWESFLYSESRAVYRGAKKAEALLGRGALLTGHMKLERPMWDALNLAHQPWHNLWKPDEIRTASVPELFGLARIRAAALAGQYAAQFDAGWLMHYHFDEPFDSGNPKK